MKRILTAVVLIAVVFAVIFLGQLWMVTLLAALMAVLAAYEYLQLADRFGFKIPLWWMAFAIALMFLAASLWPENTQLPVLTGLALGLPRSGLARSGLQVLTAGVGDLELT